MTLSPRSMGGQSGGVPASPSGHSPKGGAASSTASPAKPSVPNAWRATVKQNGTRGFERIIFAGDRPLVEVRWLGDVGVGGKEEFLSLVSTICAADSLLSICKMWLLYLELDSEGSAFTEELILKGMREAVAAASAKPERAQ